MSVRSHETTFFIALLVGVLVLTGFVVLPYLSVIALAAALAIVFHPLYRRLTLVFNGRRTAAALLVTLIVVVVIFTPLVFFGFQIFSQAARLYASAGTGEGFAAAVTHAVQGVLAKIAEALPAGDGNAVALPSVDLGGYAQAAFAWFVQHLGALFAGFANAILSFILCLMAFYYFLKDGDALIQLLFSLSPLSDDHDREIVEKMRATVRAAVQGTLVIAVVQGVLVGIGFLIFGIPDAAFWGSVAVLSALVPAIGSALVVVPGVAYLLFIGATAQGFGLLLWGTLLVGLVDNFLRPYLMKRGAEMHPFLVFVSVLGGLALFGPIGFLLGPIVMSLLIALLKIYPVVMLGKNS